MAATPSHDQSKQEEKSPINEKPYETDDGFALMCSIEAMENYHGDDKLKASCEALKDFEKQRNDAEE